MLFVVCDFNGFTDRLVWVWRNSKKHTNISHEFPFFSRVTIFEWRYINMWMQQFLMYSVYSFLPYTSKQQRNYLRFFRSTWFSGSRTVPKKLTASKNVGCILQICVSVCALCVVMCGYENNRRLYFATMLKVEGSSNCQRRIQWESSSNSYWLCGKRHVQKARHLIRKKRKWTFPLRRTAIILVSFLFVKRLV